MNYKDIAIGVLVATTLLFGYLAFGGEHVLGSSTGPQHYQRETFQQGLQVGQKGTEQSNQVTTTCSPKADVSITATTTGYAYCTGVSGVTSADTVDANFATSTVGMTMKADNWALVSAKASTTPGAIDFLFLNLTGTAAVPSFVGRMASTVQITAGH